MRHPAGTVGATWQRARMLTVKEHMTLELEHQRWKYAGAKDQAIRWLFSESPTRYYSRLNRLIDSPEALAHDPMLVRRLQRLRAARVAARSKVAS